MQVSLIGPPQSGKSTLFAAVAEAGGSHVHIDRPDQPHMAVVKVPDQRLDWLTELEKPEKTTPAELEFLDLPGFDLSDEAGRNRAKTHWAAMRQSNMLVFVVRNFEDPSVPAYRNRVNAAADMRELNDETFFADLDQITSRIHKLEVSLKKPTGKQEEYVRELELMKRLAEALESEQRVKDAIKTEADAKLVRSFALLSQKPAMAVLNCGENALGEDGPETFESLPCLQLSAKIEEEIAQLPPEDRSEFLSDLGLAEPARDRLIRACYQRLDLVSFFTTGPDECRAWTVPAGTEAVVAAAEIHSDIARGFIRAETVAYDDLKALGSMKAAKAAGKVRLEGKQYIVQDGDIIYFRFNV